MHKYFKKVKPLRVFEHALEQIRSIIETGKVAPGEKLPTEKELVDALNVGRSSIRGAVRVLEAQGLIEIKRGSGTYVTPRSDWRNKGKSGLFDWIGQRSESLIHVLEIRERIECLAVSLLADDHSDETIERLKSILDKMESLSKQGESEDAINKLADLNNTFHLTISSKCGNDIAHEIIKHVLPPFSESNKAVLFASGRLNRQIEEHGRILQAIVDRDKTEAERQMKFHIARVISEIKNISVKSG